MQVTVLLFGESADIVGSRELELKIGETSTANSLINQISRDHPLLAKHRLLVAVNEEYADADTILNAGDEIAIFTAVSGG